MTPRRVPAEGEPKSASKAETSAPDASARVGALEEELAKVNGTYLRLAADFENYRRRKSQEIDENTRYGSVGLLRALLPGLDNLSRAVSHIPADAKDGLAEGLRLTLKQLEDALASQGIRRISSVGEPFDPRRHDAVLTVPAGEAQPGSVVAELAPGYMIHDRVVRAAQVSVAEAEPDAALPAGPSTPGPKRPSPLDPKDATTEGSPN